MPKNLQLKQELLDGLKAMERIAIWGMIAFDSRWTAKITFPIEIWQ
jgi:hypothetical protein